MEEDALRNLLASISHLAMHGDIPVHAFGTLIGSARGELVAEHLHQRWLSDPNFAKIAADIVYQLHRVENRNVTVCTQVLTLALRDFRSRRKIRKRSRHMFRNYFRTLVALYPVYKQIDKYLSTCLVEPIFCCLQMLVDDSPDDSDLRCVANIMIESGETLNQLNSMECDYVMLKCRKWLTSNSIQLEEMTKFLLLNAFDLWTYFWDVKSFPDCLRRFYEKHEQNEMESENKKPASSRKISNNSAQTKNQIRRQPSVMDFHFSVLTKTDCDSDENMNKNLQTNCDIINKKNFEKEESIV